MYNTILQIKRIKYVQIIGTLFEEITSLMPSSNSYSKQGVNSITAIKGKNLSVIISTVSFFSLPVPNKI
jgi:hypothetical protein